MAQLKSEYGIDDSTLKKAITTPTSNINSWQDLANSTNQSLANYAKQGVTPNEQILANGGLNMNDYNGLVKDALVKTGNTPTTTITPLAQAVTQQAQQQYSPVQYTPVRDNSSMINDSYSNLVNALKAQIQQAQNNKNLDINGLPMKYQPQKNTSEVLKSQELRTALEQSANAGDRGGIGRQNALVTQTEGDNRMNTINLQQKSEETSLKNDIANLVLEGNIQEAQLQSQKLKDLIANNQYVDEQNYNRQTNAENTNYSRLRDTIADTGKLADGTYTQSGLMNQTNIALNQAELTEKTNPNSVTNQMAQLGLNTAKINYSILNQTQQAQVNSVLADLNGKNISNDVAQYQLDELSNPNSVTNQTAKIDLAIKNNTLKQGSQELAEYLKLAPQRLAVAKQEAMQATSATQLAQLQVKVANEELLAKKLDVKNMSQVQIDAHNKALQDIADSKSSIANRAAQLGISAGNLKLEREKFTYSKTNSASTDSAEMKQYYNSDLSVGKLKMSGSNTVDPLDNQSMINWIMSLNRTADYKANLLNTLGITK